jgi:nitroimidazol reductase NimA-like FMN-containing flavoprotein (pyridoxamine 5'-phosphate oxidase superfamily)
MRGGRGKEMSAGHRSFDTIERALRRRKFGTLSTLTEQTRPHATGVVYAVSGVSEPLVLYVTTRTTTRKARNVAVSRRVVFSSRARPRSCRTQTRERSGPSGRRGFCAGS